MTVEQVNAADVSTLSGPIVAFWIIAAMVLGGAIFTITRRNNVAAVMSLVGTFFGLAAAYALLSAHFIAALQVLVYAGAIMVLFIFVVMVLNRDETAPWEPRGIITKGVIGVGATIYLMVKLIYVLSAVHPVREGEPAAGFGTVADVGMVLFTDYLFAFEAVSLLLVVAVIAAVVVARSHHAPDKHSLDEETL